MFTNGVVSHNTGKRPLQILDFGAKLTRPTQALSEHVVPASTSTSSPGVRASLAMLMPRKPEGIADISFVLQAIQNVIARE